MAGAPDARRRRAVPSAYRPCGILQWKDSARGFVTGTLLEGCCQVGQEVELLSHRETGKIRGDTDPRPQGWMMAYAGQRNRPPQSFESRRD